MKLNSIFKIGDKVIHCNHGEGVIVAESDDPSSAIVKFDKDTWWGSDSLEVSVACLKKIR